METNTVEEFEIKQLKNRINKKGVFEISKVTVFTTKEYDLFKLLKGNREIDKARVLRIAEEMRNNDMHPHRPIIVDDQLAIIEGQHTFEARKFLSRPVYFSIAMDQDTVKIASFNNMVKQWKNEDYLRAFTNSRKPQYIAFEKWLLKHNISIAVGLCFMGGQGAVNNKAFKIGKLEMPDEDDIQFAIDLFKKLDEMNGETRRKPHIARAACIVTNANGYDQERMFRQLDTNKEKFDTQLNTMDSIRQLEEFYNYHYPMGPNYLRLM